jgi:hypothetical protein
MPVIALFFMTLLNFLLVPLSIGDQPRSRVDGWMKAVLSLEPGWGQPFHPGSSQVSACR